MHAAPRRWPQLPLPFADDPPPHGAADFLAAPSNAAARAWLARTAEWPQRRLVLWGEAGSGKTHLLHVWAAEAGARRLSGPALPDHPAAPATPLAIDDADAAPGLALLHLLNAAAEARLAVLLTARSAPSRWPVHLPDLASRLHATAAVAIGAAEDSLLQTLLVRLLAERQIVAPPAVQDWLLARLPRTAAAMREAAARLDHAALAAGRPISHAIAAAVLAGLTTPEPPAAPLPPPLPRLL